MPNGHLVATGAVNTITLEEMTFGLQVLISQHFATKARINVEIADRIIHMMEFNLVQSVLGKNLERLEAKYPTTWWDAFKERWYFAWMKRRWPVRFTRLVLKADVLYPMIPMPQEKHHLRFDLYQGLAYGR